MNKQKYTPQVGDVIIVKGTTWLAKAIQFFMNIYRRQQKLPKSVVYNHAGIVIDVWGKLIVSEATGKGIAAREPAENYVNRRKVLVKRLRNRLNENEARNMSRQATAFMFNPTRYDVFNFIHHIVLIFTGRWVGPTGPKAIKRLYCSEYVAFILWLSRGLFEKSWSVNPVDLARDQDNFEDVYKNF